MATVKDPALQCRGSLRNRTQAAFRCTVDSCGLAMPPGTSLSWLTVISRAPREATLLKAPMICSLASVTAVSLAPDVLIPRFTTSERERRIRALPASIVTDFRWRIVAC